MNTRFTITNIRRGTGDRAQYIYAEVRDGLGELCVSATLDYCVAWVNEMLSGAFFKPGLAFRTDRVDGPHRIGEYGNE